VGSARSNGHVDYSPPAIAALYANLGRQLAAHDDPDAVYRTLTAAAVRNVPGAQHAGITQGRHGRFTTLAPTDPLVDRTDKIQYELRSGPCVDAIEEDAVFDIADLRTDPRWPEFGRRAADETGVLSMLSFRLFLEDSDVVAGLNMYSLQPDAFDETARTVGLLLATHGALAVAAALARGRAHNLEQALKSNREIGVAIGVVMAQYKVTREQAFDLLRIASQHGNRKVADLAADVADTGQLPLPRPTPARSP
jgi:hypothetical protein